MGEKADVCHTVTTEIAKLLFAPHVTRVMLSKGQGSNSQEVSCQDDLNKLTMARDVLFLSVTVRLSRCVLVILLVRA